MRISRFPLISQLISPMVRRAGLTVWLACLLVSLTATVVSGTALAQGASSSTVQISLTPNQPDLTVGDPVTLTLEITYPDDHAVVIPRLERTWGPFEVLSQSVAEITVNGNGKSTTQRIDVTLFSTGTYETPTLPLMVRKPDGSVEKLLSPSVRLNVKSVLTAPDEPLRDIREPADMATPLWEQPLARVIGLGGIVTLCALGYMVHRGMRRSEAQLAEEDMRTPQEKAIQELDEIERQDLAGAGDYKQHYTLVSQIVRNYMRAICSPGDEPSYAYEMTTEELETALGNSALDSGIERLVIDLLREADSVKFANLTPSTADAADALRRARLIVAEATPHSEDAASQGTAASGRG